jgi:hypothetical protein
MLRLIIIVASSSMLFGAACGPKGVCTDCSPEDTTGGGGQSDTSGGAGESADTTTDEGTTTDTTTADTTSTSGAPGETMDESGGTDPSATGWETGGLSCSAESIMHLADARVIATADLAEPPAWAEPEGHVLILSSTPAICDAPLQGPECGVGHEYRVFVALPPGLGPGIHYFGVAAHGSDDLPDLGSWIVLSHTAQCPGGGQLPEGNYDKGVMLEVDDFDPVSSSLVGRLCGAYQPGLGDLAGNFVAQSCE